MISLTFKFVVIKILTKPRAFWVVPHNWNSESRRLEPKTNSLRGLVSLILISQMLAVLK